MKHIEDRFRLAAQWLAERPLVRLANEWRDTLFYTAFAVGLGLAVINGKGNLAIFSLTAPMEREILRSVFWGFRPEYRTAGYSATPVDPRKNCNAAAVVGGFCLFIEVALFDTFNGTSLGDAMVALMGVMQSAIGTLGLRRLNGRLQDIPNLYLNKKTGMWDWPRKRGGGGTTQTQKLKDGFMNLGRKLVAALPMPRPAQNPAFKPATQPPAARPL